MSRIDDIKDEKERNIYLQGYLDGIEETIEIYKKYFHKVK